MFRFPTALRLMAVECKLFDDLKKVVTFPIKLVIGKAGIAIDNVPDGK